MASQSVSPAGRPADTPLMQTKEQEATSLLKIGPFPSRSLQKPDDDEGEEITWNEKGRTKLAQIFVSYGDYINSIVFQFTEDDKLVISPIYGSPNLDGNNFVAIMLRNEYITGLSGSYTTKDHIIGKVVTSLKIETNATTYGPFGPFPPGGKYNINFGPPIHPNDKFNLSFGPEDQFGGFHGTSSSDFVTSIGVYVKPIFDLATSSKETELCVE